MSGFLFAMLAVVVAGLGGRDQMMIAALATKRGASYLLLAIAVLIGFLTAALAGWAATLIAPMMTTKARLLFAALAFLLACGEALFFRSFRKPQEPTQSLGALAIVLLARQLSDAARLLVVAMAVLNYAPVSAAIGGGVGALINSACAWSAPELFEGVRVRIVRRGTGALLGLVAIALFALLATG